MELFDVERLAAEAAAACDAALAKPQETAGWRDLYSALEPVAERSFEPLSRDVPPHVRGTMNQTAFLAETLRSRIERGLRADAAETGVVRDLERGARAILSALREISMKAG